MSNPKRSSVNSSHFGLNEGDRNARHHHDIDSNNFKAEEYVGSIVVHRSLTDILATTNSMAQEVNGLETELQSLVYENYSKFISAADAVHNMRNDVAELEGDMVLLAEAIVSVSSQSDLVNASLEKRRHSIEQLTSVRRLLKKLQFMFELPSRMRRAIALDALAEAVQ
jgi:hypothetical protein